MNEAFEQADCDQEMQESQPSQQSPSSKDLTMVEASDPPTFGPNTGSVPQSQPKPQISDDIAEPSNENTSKDQIEHKFPK